MSVDGNPITIGGQEFSGGFGTHADSMLAVHLGGKAARFRAYVGVDDEVAEGRGSVEFKVVGDGKSLWQSGVMKRGDAAKAVDVSLRGVQKMVLVVTGGGDGIDYDHADWADAVIELAAGGKPEDIKATALATGADLPIAKRHMGPEPKIHGPRVIGGTPGRELLFKVPVTGARPMKFEAVGIEGDLRLDVDAGIISGKTPPEGSVYVYEAIGYPMSDSSGRAARTVSSWLRLARLLARSICVSSYWSTVVRMKFSNSRL